MSDTFEERYPVEEAISIVRDRLADGWSLLGVEGLWVENDSVIPSLDHIFDGSPDGLDDFEVAASILNTWPKTGDFCVELQMIKGVD